MDKPLENIEIGIGIGAIRFGMTSNEVKDILGDPDEVEVFEEEDPDLSSTLVWHYDEVEMSLSFDEGDGDMLVALSSSSPDVKIAGKSIIGMSKDEILQFVKDFDLGEMEEEELSDEDGSTNILISLWESAVNFWIEANAVTEIQWGPLWDEEDLN